MDIAEVAKTSGLTSSPVRFYEEIESIQSNRGNGLRRRDTGKATVMELPTAQ